MDGKDFDFGSTISLHTATMFLVWIPLIDIVIICAFLNTHTKSDFCTYYWRFSDRNMDNGNKCANTIIIEFIFN